MPQFVVAFPVFETQDFDFIQSVRAGQDPQFSFVDPHFTLVFGFSGLDSAEVIEHIENVAGNHQPFTFTIRCATFVKDAFSNLTHTFLVPDEGQSDLVILHDQLYKGILESHLRLDIPFIPHITIASHEDAYKSKRYADKINNAGIAINGRIEKISLVEVANGNLSELKQFQLGAENP